MQEIIYSFSKISWMQECVPFLKFRLRLHSQLRIENSKQQQQQHWSKNISSIPFFSSKKCQRIASLLMISIWCCCIGTSRVASFLLANLSFTSFVVQHFLHIEHHVSLCSSNDVLVHLSDPSIITFVPLVT